MPPPDFPSSSITLYPEEDGEGWGMTTAATQRSVLNLDGLTKNIGVVVVIELKNDSKE